MTHTVAIMQPYFIPYGGYFRLFAASDLFVVYDCVQFPRRGWVHRNRLVDRNGALRWLTLPLRSAPQDVLIRDLQFTSDAQMLVTQRLRPFDVAADDQDGARGLVEAIRRVQGSPVDYIVRTLDYVVDYLGLPRNMIRSSTLGVPPSYRGQDRILEVARRVGANRYINAPGGRSLYDPAAFDGAGIELRFLPDYSGPLTSILSRILAEPAEQIAKEVRVPFG
jgi:hypothetical protein